jgi:ABC-2 type transport system permease protein
MFSDYLSVTRILLKNSFRKGENKNRKLFILMAVFLGFLPLVIILGIGVYQFTPVIIESGVFLEFLVLGLTMSELTIFFFGIFSILAYMFFSDDAEFLSGLPVRKTSLFMSKLTMVYINELIVSAFVLLPILFLSGISAIRSGFDLNAGYFILSALAVFIMPILPLLLVSVLAFPMMYVVSYFKRRAVLSSVVLIILFVAFMSLYFFFVGNINSGSNGVPEIEIGQSLINSLTRLSKIAFFNTIYVKAMLNTGSFVINILMFLVILSISFAITTLVASLLYQRSVTAQLEAAKDIGAKGSIGDKKDISMAFLIKDFKMLIRNPGFAFQSFMGPILTPIMIVFISKSMSVPTEGESGTAIQATSLILFLVTMLFCGTNFVAIVAFTREGKFFYFNKYLPIPYKDIIKGKLLLSYYSAMVGVVLSTIVYAFVVKTNYLIILIFGVYLSIASVGFVYMGLYRDLKKPKLEWNNVNEAVKQNFNAMIPMFIGGGIGTVTLVIGMMIESVTGKDTFLSWLLLWTVLFIPSVIIVIYYKQKLDNNYVQMLNNIEVH